MSQLDIPPKDTKRRRVKSSHSKNGCKTCKAKHIKCDERKPGCARCEKAGWMCAGYEVTPKPPKPKGRPAPKKLAPISRSDTPISRGHSPAVIPLPSLPYNQHLFRTEEEFRCFKFFQNVTVPQLSGFFDANFWGGLVLQTCEAENAVRHAAIAIGALSSQSREFCNTEGQLLRQEFAYHEYSKAIKEIWDATHRGTHSLRTNLIACLLFACFELINHNDDAAYGQISSGMKLIDDWFASHPQISREYPLRSPNRFVVEDEILQIIGRLELEATTHSNHTTASPLHSKIAYEGAVTRNIPPSFSSLHEARQYLDVLKRMAMFWRQTFWSNNFDENNIEATPIHTGLTPADVISYDDDTVARYMDMCSKHFLIVSRFEHWERAFALLWEEAQQSQSGALYLGAASLRLQFLNGYLRQSTYSGDETIYYGRYTNELREMLDISRILLLHYPTYHNQISISLDSNVIAPLDTVGCHFRDRKLRREAQQLLLANPRKEGAWNGLVCARAMEWFGELEETGLDDEEEFVPPERVLKGMEWQVMAGSRTTRVTCLEPSAFATGEWLQRELLIPSD
ncbi:hypothetical protein B0O99DRAFT_687505 [Bisporella sp. PMI_857]|nr:hypothetical protein B0O99DRAFT_687505 [Bisporella sp. PMI_857]